MLLGTFNGQMQKFRLKSQKLYEVSRFQNFVKFRFCIILINEVNHNLLDFEDTGLIFYMQTKGSQIVQQNS